MRKVNEMNEEEAARSYALYKKRLPKDFRTESKTRIAMFKESLRISCQVSKRIINTLQFLPYNTAYLVVFDVLLLKYESCMYVLCW